MSATHLTNLKSSPATVVKIPSEQEPEQHPIFYIVLSIDMTNKLVIFHCLTDSEPIAKSAYARVLSRYKYRKVRMICSGTNYKDIEGLDILSSFSQYRDKKEARQIVYKIFSKL